MKLNQPCVGTSAAPSSDVLGQPRNKDMRRAIAVLLTILVMADLGLAGETTFTGVKLAHAQGKQADAQLLLSGAYKNVVVQDGDRDFVIILYDQLDQCAYEYV